MEEARQKISQDLTKTPEILEEWKKPWKKEIIQSYEKYFHSFSTKYRKNGRSYAKNSQDTLKTLEMMEEWKKLWRKKIIQSYKKYFH